jgi:phage/plasmid-associated DNA primase
MLLYSIEEIYSCKESLLNILFQCIDDEKFYKKASWLKILEDCYRTLGRKGIDKFIQRCNKLADDDSPDYINEPEKEINIIIDKIDQENRPIITSPSINQHHAIIEQNTAKNFIKYAIEDDYRTINEWMTSTSYSYLSKKLLEMLNSDRILSYSDWRSIGKILTKISDGLKMFTDFTKSSLEKLCKSDKFKDIPAYIKNEFPIKQQHINNIDRFIDKLCEIEEDLDKNTIKDLCNEFLVPDVYEDIPVTILSDELFKKTKIFEEDEEYKTYLIKLFYTQRSLILNLCVNLFKSLSNDDIELTVLTLAWFAKKDNPKKYQKWLNERVLVSVRDSIITGYDFDICKAFYRLYWIDFIYDRHSSKWYTFDGHVWNLQNDVIEIKQKMSEEFKRFYDINLQNIREEIESSGEDIDESEKAELVLFEKKYMTIINKLTNNAGKERLIKELVLFFANGNFNKLRDSNLNLCVVKNGVIEFKNNKYMEEDEASEAAVAIYEPCEIIATKPFEFRKSMPEDYITFCAPTNYLPDVYSMEHPDVQFLLKWIHQVFTDEETENYFLKYMSACLRGRNSERIFSIWTGITSNGKSTLSEFFKETFGESYSGELESLELTSRRAKTVGANPELMKVRNCNVVFVPEADSNFILSSATIKKYTGCDRITARKLFENSETFEPRFRLVMQSNEIPSFDEIGNAIKVRTHIIPFRSTWTANASVVPATEKERLEKRLFLMDTNFKDKLKKLTPAFLWLLCEYHEKYLTEGLIPSEIMKTYTNTYFHNSDNYLEFIDQMLRDTDPAKDHDQPLDDILYKSYIDWLRSMGIREKPPKKVKFFDEISNRLSIDPKTKTIIGKCMKEV